MPIVPSRADEIKELVKKLADPSPARRESALARLLLLGERSVKSLLEGASSPDRAVRAGAAEALGRLQSPRALPALLKGLKDLDSLVVVSSAAALRRLHEAGIPQAFEPLVSLLLDEQALEESRLEALEALSSLGARDLSPLLARLQGTHAVKLGRRAAALSRGATPLEGRDGGPLTVLHLGREIERLNSEALQGASPESVAREKAEVHKGLARLGSRIALYDLREMLEARPPHGAPELLEVASVVGDRSILPSLVGLANDEPGLFSRCALALAAIAKRERVRRTNPIFRKLPKGGKALLDRLWAYRATPGRSSGRAR